MRVEHYSSKTIKPAVIEQCNHKTGYVDGNSFIAFYHWSKEGWEETKETSLSTVAVFKIKWK